MSSLRSQLDELISDEVSRVAYEHECAISALTNEVARLMSVQGVSQADLARRLGVSRARVSQLLQHKSSPTLRTMVEVAHALGSRITVALAPRDGKIAEVGSKMVKAAV